MSTLYIVATPIGNLKDITLRALETLKEVHAIACEDTRHTGKLLSAYEIKKPLISFHSHSSGSAIDRIINILNEQSDIAYVTDAGTPGISDPGSLIIQRARESGHTITPIPGPSAAAALISAAGFSGKTFIFDGFLSPKSGKRKKRLEELLNREENIVLYESPHRIIKLMEGLAILAHKRVICIGREMTKMYEEIVTGTASEILTHLREKSAIKGEFTVFIAGKKND